MDRTTSASGSPTPLRRFGRPKLAEILDALAHDFRRWVRNRDYRKCDVLGIANDGLNAKDVGSNHRGQLRLSYRPGCFEARHLARNGEPYSQHVRRLASIDLETRSWPAVSSARRQAESDPLCLLCADLSGGDFSRKTLTSQRGFDGSRSSWQQLR
jgi:hypothetical protein